MTTARILNTDSRSHHARRVRLLDLSAPTIPRPDSHEFEVLQLPTVPGPRIESRSDGRIESALAALQSAASQLQTQRDHWLEQSQREAVELGIAITERLLRRTLDIQPDAICELIRSALEWSPDTNSLRLRLHPADVDLVTSNARAIATSRELEFVPDDSLTRGDCVLETLNGQTDARLSVVLQRIAEELLAE